MFDSLLNLYGSKYRSPVLYVHFDKNVYSNNETIWFTGYLLNGADGLSYNTLSLVLVKDDNRSILMDDRFVINNGFCFGNTTIPDSVNAGAYTLIAYGNRISGDVPDAVFTQQITVKTGNQPTFNASLNPLDTSATLANQKVMLLVNFMDQKSAPVSVPVKFFVGDARKPVTTGAVKTANGQYIFNIPSSLLNMANNKLHVQVKYKAEVQDLSMVLPVASQPAQVLFFPEGGNLVNGIVNTIGWEVKSAEGKPLFANVVLYADKQVLDTVHNNGSGLGRFAFIPQKNKQYYLKLLGSNNNEVFNLPAIVNSPSLTVNKAVVNDTLIVDVHNNDPQRKLYLIGHNYSQTFFESVVENRVGQRMKIILKDVPRGLLQLTLVDSLGRPYADRLIFAHYNNTSRLEITTDNATYAARKKVKLNIKLTGLADNAAVSVAVVQANRVEMRNKNDIETYIHLRQKIGELPLKENYFSNTFFDKRDLEDLLLIKGWSRYKWTDVLKAEQNTLVSKETELKLSGKVTRLIGKFKPPVMLITLNPGAMYETDINGNFALPDSNILTEPNKTIGIMVANGDVADYKIDIVNPYDTVNKVLALNMSPVTIYTSAQQNSSDLSIPGTERAIQLKEVVIKDKKVDDVFYPKFGGIGANECGDYVCQYNILNCPNHRFASGNTPPIVGMSYQGRVYQGCQIMKVANKQTGLKFKGIYAAQEFYPSDYSEINPSQPEYLSTIYWKNQLLLKKGEVQEVSFYTGDITGPFKVIVQGITADDVIYGEAVFNVKKQ
ncbi:hypothetical protein [Mucilaginibacter auburnensis]|nr:hypothetical protein [Mucilaginibacter auburnensis]